MFKKLIYFIFFIFLFYLAYGLYLTRIKVEVTQEVLAPPEVQQFYDYKGILNVHTNKGKGSGGFEEILAAAKSTGVDFLVITDSNDFAIAEKQDGYFDQVFVFFGGEYSYLNSRILNFNIQNAEHLQGLGRTQIQFTDLLNRRERNKEAGLFVLAHPLKRGYQWSGDYPPGLVGVEVFNLRQIWQWTWQNKRRSFFWTLLIYPFNPDLAFTRLLKYAGEDEIYYWSELNLKRPFVGFAGSQAESRFRINQGNYLNYPGYEKLFSLASNHVLLRSELTGNVQADQMKIAEALAKGQFYMSFDFLGNPYGFNAYMKNNRGRIAPMGAIENTEEEWSLHIQLPSRPLVGFETIIFKDGHRVLTSNSLTTEYRLHSPGTYRAMVRMRVKLPFPDRSTWLPWIYTNHFYLKSSESSE